MKGSTHRRRSPLIALSSAALSLPAFSSSQPVETELSLRTTAYREADVPAHRVVSGSDDRYDIDINQFRLITPVGDDWSLGLDVNHESMSGASPWGTIMGINGEPNLIMSGATIR